MARPKAGATTAKPWISERIVRAGILLAGRLTRSMLLGVRGVVTDADGRVLLVRHTYSAGWHLPGGGVEVGETLSAALERELAEEANVVMTAPASLHGVFFNPTLGNRDHVAVYIVGAHRITGPRQPDREIAACGFFPIDALPANTTRPVKARLAEIFDGQPLDPIW